MTTISNSAPYYDDFDKTKNYHQILFRPGFAVQARELTQIQSILKNQIEQFGNHIFRQGSIVIPGNSRGDLAVPYAKIQPTFNSAAVDVTRFQGQLVRGETSGVTGIVKTAVGATDTDPITFYIAYLSGGVIDDEANGLLAFQSGETLVVEGTTIKCTLAETAATGVGSLAFVNEGVYYANGTFIHVDTQSVVIDKYDTTPSCHVLLQIIEETVTSDEDASLLDPSQGSSNFAAPGADRYKIYLKLVTLPLGSTINNNYVEIMRYRDGVLEEHARNPKYSELEKSLARRTFDESGNYVVSGLNGKVSEHKRVSNNGGIDPDGDIDKFAITVSPGKAYINGFEVETIAPKSFVQDKARTPIHTNVKDYATKLTYGQYFFATNIAGDLGAGTRKSFDLYNDNDPGNGSATKVGSARIVAIDYHSGDPSSPLAIYKLYYCDLQIDSTLFELTDIGGVRVSGGSGSATVCHRMNVSLSAGTLAPNDIILSASGTRVATVARWDPALSELFVFKHLHTASIPLVGDQFTSGSVTSIVKGISSTFVYGQNSALFKLPVVAPKSLKDIDGFYKHTYTVQKNLQITTNSSGAGSVTISDGIFDSLDVGAFSAFSSSGPVSILLFTVSVSGTQLSIAGGPTSATIFVQCNVNKSFLAPRTKTSTIGVSAITSYTANQRTFTLDNSDVYQLTSISDSTGPITANFDLDSGQTDYFYNKSKIVLKVGRPAPVGTITVNYVYFAHSAGDFFCIDSYTANPDYENLTLKHRTSTGEVIDLRQYIDFRSTASTADYIAQDIPVNDDWFRSPIQFYMGRFDLLVIDKNRDIQVISGTPAEQPKVPTVPANSFAIEQYYVPPYTTYVTSIGVTRYSVGRFTMSDINGLSNRVQRLEEFSTLSATESDLINYEVIDAQTGLSRFKTGYLVENFANPITIADVTAPSFRSSFNRRELAAAQDQMLCPVNVHGGESTAFTVTNGVVTLPYVEGIFAEQNLSSRVTNLNPFLVISWDGVVTLAPTSDSWTEVLDLPEIFDSRTDTVIVTTWVPAPVPAPVWVPAPPVVIPIPIPSPPPVQPPAPAPVPIPPPPPAVPPAPQPNFWDGGGLGDGGAAGADGGNGNGPGGNGGDGGGGGGGGGDCFTATTLVQMSNGEFAEIATIQIGDRVLSADGTTINTVLYVERVVNDKPLYSPLTDVAPFATINHPMALHDGILRCVDSSQTRDLYPWLNITHVFNNVTLQMPKGELVYNLWVDGDNTYTVNTLGTHSIIGDGGALRQNIISGAITHDEGMEILRTVQTEYYSHIGSYLANKALAGYPAVGRCVAKCLVRKGVLASVVIGGMKVIGFLDRCFSKLK